MVKRYFAYVDKDPDSAYGIQFPDFPTVFSAADEEKDIISNAMGALQLYDKYGGAMPEPSSYAAIIENPEVKEALRGGAYLISVPYAENDAETVRANVTFERGLLRLIDAAAKARRLSRSAFLATAARHEMEISH